MVSIPRLHYITDESERQFCCQTKTDNSLFCECHSRQLCFVLSTPWLIYLVLLEHSSTPVWCIPLELGGFSYNRLIKQKRSCGVIRKDDEWGQAGPWALRGAALGGCLGRRGDCLSIVLINKNRSACACLGRGWGG